MSLLRGWAHSKNRMFRQAEERIRELEQALANEVAEHRTTRRALERVSDRNRELSARRAYALKTVEKWGKTGNPHDALEEVERTLRGQNDGWIFRERVK